MKETRTSRLSRYSWTTLLVGCSAGGSSFLAGIFTGEQNQYMFSGLLVMLATMLLVAGFGALTLKQYPVRVDPKKHYMEQTPREQIPAQRWFMVVFCFSSAIFFLVIAGMYYCGKDPMSIPKNVTEQDASSDR